MRILAVMIVLAVFAFPAGAVDIDKFDGTEQMEVGSTRLLINNFLTFQCGWCLVFNKEATVKKKDGNIALSVKTIPAVTGECGCKAHTNDFHLYRARSGSRLDKRGFYIEDELVAKGRIGPSNSRTFVVAAIHRADRRSDYYVNFDCTD
jgi:hypothetical protein